ncbi:MAG: four helix bundle protein [Peptococcaceae bacterium]|nr:four helix bundle protein [Peptococcaceae bacterium]
MRDYKELKVWQRSHQLAVAIYKATVNFPKEEIYGLVSQIRRSCVSIAANIAEGCGRNGNAEFRRFLQISIGSANELEYYLLLCHDIGLLRPSDYNRLTGELREIKKMLNTFIQKLKTVT